MKKRNRDSREEDRVLFGGRIPPDLRQKAKIYAAAHKLQIQELLELALNRILNERPEVESGRKR